MSPFVIRCFKPSTVVKQPAFFILSRGRNTGRPSFESCPNCFVFTCENSTDLQSYYWLVYALWTGCRFHPYLCGSVIEFIHLRDLKDLVSTSVDQVKDISKVIRPMQKILELETHLNRQAQLVKEAKRAVLRDLIG